MPAPPAKARYRLYIDESGTHTYDNLDDPSRRYLAVLGVWFKYEDVVAFADDLEAMKRGFWGARPDTPVILHRNDITNRRGPFSILKDPEVQSRFDSELIELVGRARFRMVCVVIDKLKHRRKYADPRHPYHYCLEDMLDRYCGWLGFTGAVGDVLAEARGKKEDRELNEAYRHTYDNGTYWFRPPHHRSVLTSKEIKIKDKGSCVPGLQLADILAHPTKQAMLAEEGLIPPISDCFGKRLTTTASVKFNCKWPSGLIAGYGKVWIPSRK